MTSCRPPHRQPPGLAVPSWPGLAGRRPWGGFRDFLWLAGPPTVTSWRPGRSCSWGRGPVSRRGHVHSGLLAPRQESTPRAELPGPLLPGRPRPPTTTQAPPVSSAGTPRCPYSVPAGSQPWQPDRWPGRAPAPGPVTVDERRSRPLCWAWPARASRARLWGSAPATPRALGSCSRLLEPAPGRHPIFASRWTFISGVR